MRVIQSAIISFTFSKSIYYIKYIFDEWRPLWFIVN